MNKYQHIKTYFINVSFLSFKSWIKGSHHIFYHENLPEIINIQEKNGKAKAYQVKQIRNLIIKYELQILEDDQI